VRDVSAYLKDMIGDVTSTGAEDHIVLKHVRDIVTGLKPTWKVVPVELGQHTALPLLNLDAIIYVDVKRLHEYHMYHCTARGTETCSHHCLELVVLRVLSQDVEGNMTLNNDSLLRALASKMALSSRGETPVIVAAKRKATHPVDPPAAKKALTEVAAQTPVPGATPPSFSWKKVPPCTLASLSTLKTPLQVGA
jgi:hypothetical protein